MIGVIAHTRNRLSVWWPFRVAAALLCATILVGGAVYCTELSMKRLPGSLTLVLLGIPGMLWLFRMAYYAARFGCTPVLEHWPFASDRVFNWYVVLLIAGVIWR